MSEDNGAERAQAALDREDELLHLRLLQRLLVEEDAARFDLAQAKRDVRQAERRLNEAELSTRAEIRRTKRGR